MIGCARARLQTWRQMWIRAIRRTAGAHSERGVLRPHTSIQSSREQAAD